MQQHRKVWILLLVVPHVEIIIARWNMLEAQWIKPTVQIHIWGWRLQMFSLNHLIQVRSTRQRSLSCTSYSIIQLFLSYYMIGGQAMRVSRHQGKCLLLTFGACYPFCKLQGSLCYYKLQSNAFMYEYFFFLFLLVNLCMGWIIAPGAIHYTTTK